MTRRGKLALPPIGKGRHADMLINRLNAGFVWSLDTWTRAVVRAMDAGHMSSDEIAQEFNSTPDTVQQTYRRERRRRSK